MFKRLIAYLIYKREWYWLELLISNLCELEMQFKCAFDKKFKDMIDTCTITTSSEEECEAHKLIPKNTFYCYDDMLQCSFHDISRIAYNLYGSQRCGYCYYLGKGDFSFIRPTELLWDSCKECGISYYDGED